MTASQLITLLGSLDPDARVLVDIPRYYEPGSAERPTTLERPFYREAGLGFPAKDGSVVIVLGDATD